MKKNLSKLLCLFALVLLMNSSHGANCISPLSPAVVQQHMPHDTTSYWYVTNGYYITFTKDSVPNQWVYKASKPAASVPNPDPNKKAPATVVNSGGPALRISLGNKIFLFRNMPATNTLRYMTSITNAAPPSSEPATTPSPKQ